MTSRLSTDPSRMACQWLAIVVLAMTPAWGHGDIDSRIEKVSRELEQRPEDAELHLQRGWLHHLHADWTASLSDYDRAEQLAPAWAEVTLRRAKTLLAASRLPEARLEIDRHLAREPRSVDGRVTRAQIEVRMNEPLAAAADYSQAREASGRLDPDRYVEWARALAAPGVGRADEAIRVLDHAMAQLGPVPSLGLLALELEVGQRQFDQALVRIELLSRGATRRETWLERRGDVLQAAGRTEEARRAYSDAQDQLNRLPPRIRRRGPMLALATRLQGKRTLSPAAAGSRETVGAFPGSTQIPLPNGESSALIPR